MVRGSISCGSWLAKQCRQGKRDAFHQLRFALTDTAMRYLLVLLVPLFANLASAQATPRRPAWEWSEDTIRKVVGASTAGGVALDEEEGTGIPVQAHRAEVLDRVDRGVVHQLDQ